METRKVLAHKWLLLALGLVALAAVAFFMTWNSRGQWDFILPRRAEQVFALAIVGVAIAVSTVMFQTLTSNRILTPSIMGFDALYVLIAATMVFIFGIEYANNTSPITMFLINSTLLIGAATALYQLVLRQQHRGLYTVVLLGVIMGTLFRGISSFMFRVMDPNEFDTLMSKLFASFNRLETSILLVAATLLVIGIIAAFRMVRVLDVITLGQTKAITLGVDYRRTVTKSLLIVSLLVAVSTALVGPVTFLGLLVANLAYRLTKTHLHHINFVAAALLGIIALVLGQAVLHHVLRFNGTLASIINLVGGIYFISLLVKESRK